MSFSSNPSSPGLPVASANRFGPFPYTAVHSSVANAGGATDSRSVGIRNQLGRLLFFLMLFDLFCRYFGTFAPSRGTIIDAVRAGHSAPDTYRILRYSDIRLP